MTTQKLQTVKHELDRVKAQLGAAQLRRDEVMGVLTGTYGLKTAKAAEAEHKKLITKTIPTMEAKRDELVAKAAEVLNGINTESGAGGHAGAPGGPAGPANTVGAGAGRTPVGRKR